MKQKIWIKQEPDGWFSAYSNPDCSLRNIILQTAAKSEERCIERTREALKRVQPQPIKEVFIDIDESEVCPTCGEEVKDSTVPCPECQQAKAEMREER